MARLAGPQILVTRYASNRMCRSGISTRLAGRIDYQSINLIREPQLIKEEETASIASPHGQPISNEPLNVRVGWVYIPVSTPRANFRPEWTYGRSPEMEGS